MKHIEATRIYREQYYYVMRNEVELNLIGYTRDVTRNNWTGAIQAYLQRVLLTQRLITGMAPRITYCGNTELWLPLLNANLDCPPIYNGQKGWQSSILTPAKGLQHNEQSDQLENTRNAKVCVQTTTWYHCGAHRHAFWVGCWCGWAFDAKFFNSVYSAVRAIALSNLRETISG